MRRVLVGLFAASMLFGQATAFDRLQQEAARTKSLLATKESLDEQAANVIPLHIALRDWIESRLPQTLGPTGAELRNLETSLQVQLQVAGLSAPASSDDTPPGYVDLEFKWLPELPDALIVVGGVSVQCGEDDAFYLYRFHSGGRTRALENHPKSNSGFGGHQFQLSDPDSQGRRLLLLHYTTVQCASTWMGMAYSVYRLDTAPDAVDLLLAEVHDFWLGNDGPEFVLKPNELTVEFLDASVDGGIHNRTRIHHYRLNPDVKRVDPVAFQPQDFAEEWLTRPWNEMESRSDSDTEEWHQQLHSDYVGAEYSGVIPCASPGQWLISFDIMRVGDKDVSSSSPMHFLIRDLGNYQYKMDAVSKYRPVGCEGEGIVSGAGLASDKHPWLSTAELKALR
jgi:hypothetical protein